MFPKGLFITFFIAAFLLSMACSKDPQIERVFFEFEMPFTVTPGTDTVRIGDTLRMEAQFSDSLFDALSQRKYGLNCWKFPTFMVLRELVFPDKNYAFQKSATEAFDFFFAPNNGGITGNAYGTIELKCIQGFYQFSLKIVPKRKGVFAIAIIHESSGFIELPQFLAPFTGELRRIPVARYNRYIINRGITHFSIFKQHATQALPDNWPLLEEYRTYTFVVK